MVSGISSISDALGRIGGAEGVVRPAAAVPQTAEVGGSFMDVLGQMASNSVQTIKSGEAASIAAVKGDIGTQQVVEAVLSAEQQMYILVGLRDKMVSAYMEIGRMTI